MKKNRALFISYSAVIASLYVVLTFLSNIFSLSVGLIQFRFSEILAILPLFSITAIPGLTIGCLISNILTGCPLWDVLLGTLATLIGAIGTYFIGEKSYLLSLFPPILSNAIIVPIVYTIIYSFGNEGFIAWFCGVFVGEFVMIALVGSILYNILKKNQKNLFKI
ncbi:MAG: QueT transporter family protein [Ruminococcaceae bacterium]|nr:QueT transporter family protein [Oscillospiraceae bacterium]